MKLACTYNVAKRRDGPQPLLFWGFDCISFALIVGLERRDDSQP